RLRSAFTETVIQGLSTGAADLTGQGRITPDDLWRYVRMELPRRTTSQSPSQFGQVSDEIHIALSREGHHRQRQRRDHRDLRLGDLLGPLEPTDDVRLCAVDWRRRGLLKVPVGQAHRLDQPAGEPLWLDLASSEGHLLVVGRAGTGKTTLLRTIVGGLALTHSDQEVAFHCLESGGNWLGPMRRLPHVREVVGDDEVAEVGALLDRLERDVLARKKLFRRYELESPTGLRARRATLDGGPYPDVFLVVDRWQDFAALLPDFTARVVDLANKGLGYGVHVAVVERSWRAIPEELLELPQARIETRLSQPQESRVSPDLAGRLPANLPGWAIHGRRTFRIALPDLTVSDADPETEAPGAVDEAGLMVALIAQAWSSAREPEEAVAGRRVRPPFSGHTDEALALIGVAGRRDVEAVGRTVAEVVGILDRREDRFAELGIESMAAYRRLRAEGAYPDDPFGDVFLVVDGWPTLRREHEELEEAVADVAVRGLSYGVHLLVTSGRWGDFRPGLRDRLETRLELRLADPYESEMGRRAAANVPERSPGRGLAGDRAHFLAALPRVDGRDGVADLAEATAELVAGVAAAWPGEAAPPVRLLPLRLTVAELDRACPAGERGLPIGLDEATLGPVVLDPAADPHLVVFGDAECGKTNLLRLVARQVVARHSPAEARLVLADYRRGLLGAVEGEHLLDYAPSEQSFAQTVAEIRAVLHERLPGPDVTPQQLRERSWWRGPELFVLVDDYDLMAAGGTNPLHALRELLPVAGDVGLHVVLARRSGGAGRAIYEPVLQTLRELGSAGLLMSGDRGEGAILGSLRPRPLPPGRGVLVRRREGQQLIQTALAEA
ncbi:type VII secretion protein EccCb, partial [Micromonospora sp. DH15]|nr:type VII secretion protein EccCb [Micromonospora sp. DH15]